MKSFTRLHLTLTVKIIITASNVKNVSSVHNRVDVLTHQRRDIDAIVHMAGLYQPCYQLNRGKNQNYLKQAPTSTSQMTARC